MLNSGGTVTIPRLRPVDSERSVRQFPDVSKKQHKVGESAAPYTAKKTVKGKAVVPAPTKAAHGDRTDAAFQNVTDKIFAERKELLRKLAQ